MGFNELHATLGDLLNRAKIAAEMAGMGNVVATLILHDPDAGMDGSIVMTAESDLCKCLREVIDSQEKMPIVAQGTVQDAALGMATRGRE